MDPIEMLPICTAKINEHESALFTAESYSNAHAYHLGQAIKWQRTRRMLKDIAESETRYLRLTATENA